MSRYANGGFISSGDPGDDRIPIVLSRGHQITDPDEAEALGLTVDARRLRAERSGPGLCEHLVAAIRLINDLTDADDCWFDHHGGCQAHGYLSLEPGEKCPQREAKEMVEAHRALIEDGAP